MEDNKTLEEMEMMETETDLVEVEDTETYDSEETAKSGIGWKLALGLAAGSVAVGTAIYKKAKAKKSGKPKRKMRLRWVDVSEEDFDDDLEEDIIDGEAEIIDEEEPEEKK